MRINNNLMAMNTHRQLGINNAASAKSTEKLSSGLRINRAGDDAAGLAISEKMRGQIRGLNQASRNSQDGISMIQTAEGALNESQAILQRMRELSVQSANDTNTSDDRGEIQKEMNELTSEISRIGNTTEFNTQNVLKGKDSVGSITNGTTVEGASAVAAVPGTTGFTITTKLAAGDSITVGGNTITAYADAASLTASGDAFGIDIATQDDVTKQATAIFAMTANFAGVDITNPSAGKVVFTQTVGGTGDITAATESGTGGLTNDTPVAGVAVVTTQIGSTSFKIDTALVAGETLEVGGKTVTVYEDAAAMAAANNGFGDTFGIDITVSTTAKLQGDALTAMTAGFAGITVTDDDAGTVTLTQGAAGIGDATEAGDVTAVGGEDFTATLQIGSNQSQSFELTISDMRSSALGISGDTGADAVGASATAVVGASFAATDALSDNSGTAEFALDVSSSEKATAAITVLDQALSAVSSERSKLGASQNRLEHTIKNLDTSSENLQAAESRIRDVDMAKEIMTNSKNGILAQAAQAMLAQANQAPQGVLQLLR